MCKLLLGLIFCDLAEIGIGDELHGGELFVDEGGARVGKVFGILFFCEIGQVRFSALKEDLIECLIGYFVYPTQV